MGISFVFGGRSVLRPQYGINMRGIGFLEPASEIYQIDLFIDLPHFNYIQVDFDNFTCPDNLDAYTNNICENYVPVFATYKERAIQLENTITDKISGLHTRFNMPHNREERSLTLAAISGFFNFGINAINNFIKHKRISSLNKSIKYLKDEHFSLKSEFYDFRKDMVTISEIQSKNIKNNTRHIAALSYKLKHLSKQIEENFQELSSRLDHMDKRLGTIRLVSKLSANIFIFINERLTMLENLNSYLDKIQLAMIDLMSGKIPISILAPSHFHKILSHTSEIMYQVNPEYRFAFNSLDEFYLLNNVGYIISNNRLIFSLGIPIVRAFQKPFKLFQIDTVFVPVNITNNTKNSYTRLEQDSDFIAVYENNFIHLSKKQLDLCTKYTDRYLCDDTLLMIDSNKKTCLEAIYWNDNPDVIKSLCNFKFYYNIKPTASLLDAGDQILLANFDTPWTIQCTKSPTPIRHSGDSYVIIERNDLCNCAIISKSYYIPPKITGCDDNPYKLNLKYSLNGAMALYFSKMSNNNVKLELNMSELFDEKPSLNLPSFDIIDNSHSDVMNTQSNDGIDLDKFSSIISKHKEIYLNQYDKIHDDSHISNWFENHNISLGIMFVLSLLGSLSLIITIITCIKAKHDILRKILVCNRVYYQVVKRKHTDDTKETEPHNFV